MTKLNLNELELRKIVRKTILKNEGINEDAGEIVKDIGTAGGAGLGTLAIAGAGANMAAASGASAAATLNAAALGAIGTKVGGAGAVRILQR